MEGANICMNLGKNNVYCHNFSKEGLLFMQKMYKLSLYGRMSAIETDLNSVRIAQRHKYPIPMHGSIYAHTGYCCSNVY